MKSCISFNGGFPVKTVCILLIVTVVSICDRAQAVAAMVNPEQVPPYVSQGLETYGREGYEKAVHVWLAGSPYESGATVASNIAFFKNIEKLAGKFVSYDYLMTRQTVSSNVVYVRINYERFPGFILFTSAPRNGKWVLTSVKLDRVQRFGGQ